MFTGETCQPSADSKQFHGCCSAQSALPGLLWEPLEAHGDVPHPSSSDLCPGGPPVVLLHLSVGLHHQLSHRVTRITVICRAVGVAKQSTHAGPSYADLLPRPPRCTAEPWACWPMCRAGCGSAQAAGLVLPTQVGQGCNDSGFPTVRSSDTESLSPKCSSITSGHKTLRETTAKMYFTTTIAQSAGKKSTSRMEKWLLTPHL